MKAEFEITITKEGVPAIKFTHHDKSNFIEQILLGLFLKQAKEHGIKLVNTSGFLESLTDNSHENYLILPNKE